MFGCEVHLEVNFVSGPIIQALALQMPNKSLALSDFAASLLDACISLPVHPFFICKLEARILSSFVDHFEISWESGGSSRLQSS